MKTKLHEIRKRKGHTIAQAAKKAGIAYTAFWAAEAGKRIPSAKTLGKLSKYYGLPEAEILQIIAILRERRRKIEQLDSEFLAKLSS